MLSPRVSTTANWLLRACMWAFFASCGFFLWLSRNRPAQPSPETGHVIELSNKGHPFFVTPFEAALAQATFAIVPISLAIMTFTQAHDTRQARHERDRNGVDYLLGAAGVIALSVYMFWPQTS